MKYAMKRDNVPDSGVTVQFQWGQMQRDIMALQIW